MKYLCNNEDDSPLYLFHNCDEDQKLKKKYNVPKFFKEDYLSILKSSVRPPYRWLLIGPRRSGSKIHLDPLNTSAWNTSLKGYKLWIIFPNKCPKWIIEGKHLDLPRSISKECISYFHLKLKTILEKEGDLITPYICLQKPGDTIFVPGGWWHGVLNVTDTMAITQNYMNSINFEYVWKSLRVERKMLASFFLRTMKKKNPSIFIKAKKANIRDSFVMYKDRTEIRFEEDHTTTTVENSSSRSTSSSSDYQSLESESSNSNASCIKEEEPK